MHSPSGISEPRSLSSTTPAPDAPPSLLARLRQETADLHARLEARIGLPDALQSEDDLRRLLIRYYGFYTPLEDSLLARIADWERLELDPEARRKTGYLEADLAFLGVDSPALTQLPRCPAPLLPNCDSTARLIGCVYVLEGATLGGQIIGRHIEEHLGLPAGSTGTTFFHCYGASVGAMWQQFRRAAERYASAYATGPERETCDRGAVASARQTFEALEGWLFS